MTLESARPHLETALVTGASLFENASTMTPEAAAETGHDASRDDRMLIVPGWPNKPDAHRARLAQ